MAELCVEKPEKLLSPIVLSDLWENLMGAL